MHFIFPQNYNFNTKLFGIIDYPTAILNIILWLFSFFTLKILPFNFTIKIIIFIIFCFPVFLISIIGFNHENIIYVFSYLLNYAKSKKIYLYNK